MLTPEIAKAIKKAGKRFDQKYSVDWKHINVIEE